MGFFGPSPEPSASRLRVIEKKLDLILQNLGIPFEDAPLEEVAELARTGKKIEAIKRYRELTGAGLKEAKDAVDAIR